MDSIVADIIIGGFETGITLMAVVVILNIWRLSRTPTPQSPSLAQRFARPLEAMRQHRGKVRVDSSHTHTSVAITATAISTQPQTVASIVPVFNNSQVLSLHLSMSTESLPA